jgi:hypothetical protein
MDNVYISPDGLDGEWEHGSGEEYEELRDRVIELLSNLRDDDGGKPVIGIVKWEDVEEFLDLPPGRVGDLVIANEAGYGWNEEMSADLEVFDDSPLKTGYKQAIYAEQENGMWTPFIVMGPGVKKGYVIEEPIGMVDQYPTIMALMGVPVPDESILGGQALEEIFSS